MGLFCYNYFYKMKLINDTLLDATYNKAKESPRLRMNYNFHKNGEDPINRLLNAILPESYIRPHRHSHPKKNEMFFVLRGKAVVFIYDEKGQITETQTIAPSEGLYGAEIAPGLWHSLLVIEPNTVVYEIKEGPFKPLDPMDLAPWSPEAEDVKAVSLFMNKLRNHLLK